MSQNLINEKSTLVQIMACCHEATSHYLSQCWPRSLLPYGITRPQWHEVEPESVGTWNKLFHGRKHVLHQILWTRKKRENLKWPQHAFNPTMKPYLPWANSMSSYLIFECKIGIDRFRARPLGPSAVNKKLSMGHANAKPPPFILQQFMRPEKLMIDCDGAFVLRSYMRFSYS